MSIAAGLCLMARLPSSKVGEICVARMQWFCGFSSRTMNGRSLRLSGDLSGSAGDCGGGVSWFRKSLMLRFRLLIDCAQLS